MVDVAVYRTGCNFIFGFTLCFRQCRIHMCTPPLPCLLVPPTCSNVCAMPGSIDVAAVAVWLCCDDIALHRDGTCNEKVASQYVLCNLNVCFI